MFPHISIAEFDAGGKFYMVSQLFPGATPDESITVQNFLLPGSADEHDLERRKQVEEMMAFLLGVVRDEDYYTGKRIQQALKSGAKEACLFGRNEGGGQRFHRWVDALVQADYEALPELLRSGIGE